MKRGISTVEVVTGLAFTLFAVAAIVTLSYGYSFADALFIQPAVTQAMAQKAIDAVEPGWSVDLSGDRVGHDDFHTYIFRKDGQRRDVNVKRERGGEWQSKVTPVFQ